MSYAFYLKLKPHLPDYTALGLEDLVREAMFPNAADAGKVSLPALKS